MIDFLQYVTSVTDIQDLHRLKEKFNEEIKNQQDQINEFVIKSKERIALLEQYEKDNQFFVLGHTTKSGRKKEILLIIRYPDGTQREERYSFDSIKDMKLKLSELKNKYNKVDWSKFEEEIN